MYISIHHRETQSDLRQHGRELNCGIAKAREMTLYVEGPITI